MVMAIYALLLFLNEQFGLFIETTFSWAFCFPILIYASTQPIYPSIICAIGMILETLLFGGFTTWFYSWTSILIGLFYGICTWKRKSSAFKLGGVFILSFLSYWLIFFLYAKIFALDYMEDFKLFHEIFPFLDLFVFLTLTVVLLSLLQTICIHLLAMMIYIRMKIETVPMKKVWQIKPPLWLGVGSIILLVVFLASQSVIECSERANDLILIAFALDLMALDYYGVVYMIHYCIAHRKRQWTFFAILLGFIPPLCLISIGLGELDCLLSLRHRRSKKENGI